MAPLAKARGGQRFADARDAGDTAGCHVTIARGVRGASEALRIGHDGWLDRV